MTTDRMAVVVPLSTTEAAEATEMAFADDVIDRRRDPDAYGGTHGHHESGRMGEIGCEKWLVNHGAHGDSPFRGGRAREVEADIVTVNDVAIDLKTWRAETWGRAGRSIRRGQVGRLRRKADAVVFATWFREPSGGATVILMGWSLVRTLDWEGKVDGVPASKVEEAAQRLTGSNRIVDDLSYFGPSAGDRLNVQTDVGSLRPMDDLLNAHLRRRTEAEIVDVHQPVDPADDVRAAYERQVSPTACEWPMCLGWAVRKDACGLHLAGTEAWMEVRHHVDVTLVEWASMPAMVRHNHLVDARRHRDSLSIPLAEVLGVDPEDLDEDLH